VSEANDSLFVKITNICFLIIFFVILLSGIFETINTVLLYLGN